MTAAHALIYLACCIEIDVSDLEERQVLSCRLYTLVNMRCSAISWAINLFAAVPIRLHQDLVARQVTAGNDRSTAAHGTLLNCRRSCALNKSVSTYYACCTLHLYSIWKLSPPWSCWTDKLALPLLNSRFFAHALTPCHICMQLRGISTKQ